jgi:hypothetical protein
LQRFPHFTAENDMRLATLALAVLLALGVTACNRDSGKSPQQTPSSSSSTGPASAPPTSPSTSTTPPPPPTTASPTERSDGHPPVQGQVDAKSPPQQRDFEVKK